MSRYGQRTRVSTSTSDWLPLNPPLFISGGQETVTVGGYKYVVFTSSGNLTVSGRGDLSYFAVGGGGSGGYSQAGGGGGGELDLFTSTNVGLNAIVAVTIGAGGVGTSNDATNTNGGNTLIDVDGVNILTTLGGGAGRGTTGNTGGSGGGANTTGGSASGDNTNVGGNNGGNPYVTGGGGGATAVGGNANSNTSGNGGLGYTMTSIDANLTAANFPTSFTGMTVLSSGAGGGAYNFLNRGAGATGAGRGGQNGGGATAGTSYGSGGGGGGRNGGPPYTSYPGQNGKSGVVVFRVIA